MPVGIRLFRAGCVPFENLITEAGLRAKSGENRFTDRGEMISPLQTVLLRACAGDGGAKLSPPLYWSIAARVCV